MVAGKRQTAWPASTEREQVRAGGDGVGGRGNVRRASQAGAHLSLRRGIRDLHTIGGKGRGWSQLHGPEHLPVPEMEGDSSKVKPDP